MSRTQLLAAIVIIALGLGLVVGRRSLSDSTTANAAPGADGRAPADDSTSDDTTAPDDSSTDDTTGDDADDDRADGTTGEGGVEPEVLGPAPALTELDGWLQTEATSFDHFDGQVRIVQFWTFGCHNCKATIPHLQAIYERWHDEGLEIIGVHAPEFDYEKDPDAIAAAADDHGVTWPIALDTDKVNFRAWQPGRRFWPRTFVIDEAGQIRFDHIGEGRYDELEATVAHLIANGP